MIDFKRQISGRVLRYQIDSQALIVDFAGPDRPIPLELQQPINPSERAYTSDRKAYEVFVGQITPQEFVAPFGNINKAISNLIENWPYDEPVPSWLEAALFRYVEDRLDEQA